MPIEVIPMAKSLVARELAILGGQAELRHDFITDNGNIILDVHNLKILNPPDLEKKINNIAGCGHQWNLFIKVRRFIDNR